MELPKGPSHPCFNSSSSLKYPSQLERKHESLDHIQGAPIPPRSSRGGILSLCGQERIPVIPVASQEEAISTEKREELHGRATIPRVPQVSQSIPGKPVFPSLPRLSSRGSTHTTVALETALWESLVGKPRGKATDSLIHAKGSGTLLLQLRRKAHVHAPTPDED